jgi:hypothetical protein
LSRLPSCGSESKGELLRRLHAEAATWSDLIELHAPGRDHHQRLAQRIKQLVSMPVVAVSTWWGTSVGNLVVQSSGVTNGATIPQISISH